MPISYRSPFDDLIGPEPTYFGSGEFGEPIYTGTEAMGPLGPYMENRAALMRQAGADRQANYFNKLPQLPAGGQWTPIRVNPNDPTSAPYAWSTSVNGQTMYGVPARYDSDTGNFSDRWPYDSGGGYRPNMAGVSEYYRPSEEFDFKSLPDFDIGPYGGFGSTGDNLSMAMFSQPPGFSYLGHPQVQNDPGGLGGFLSDVAGLAPGLSVFGAGAGISNLAGMLGAGAVGAGAGGFDAAANWAGIDALPSGTIDLGRALSTGTTIPFDPNSASSVTGIVPTAGGAAAAGGTGMWDDVLDNWDLFGAGSNAVTPFSAAAGAGDPIEALIQATNSGMAGADAIRVVEQQFPGSTQSVLQFLMNNPGSIPGTTVRSLLGMASGGGDSGGGSSGQDLTLGRLLSGLGVAGLGAYGANQQANALRDIAAGARADRAPFLEYSRSLLSGGPEAYAAGPGAGATKGLLNALSVRGNPFGNPGDLMRGSSQLGSLWQNAVTGFGNMGLAGEDTRAQLATGAAGADLNRYREVAAGIGDIFAPKQMTLADILKAIGKSGVAAA